MISYPFQNLFLSTELVNRLSRQLNSAEVQLIERCHLITLGDFLVCLKNHGLTDSYIKVSRMNFTIPNFSLNSYESFYDESNLVDKKFYEKRDQFITMKHLLFPSFHVPKFLYYKKSKDQLNIYDLKKLFLCYDYSGRCCLEKNFDNDSKLQSLKYLIRLYEMQAIRNNDGNPYSIPFFVNENEKRNILLREFHFFLEILFRYDDLIIGKFSLKQQEVLKRKCPSQKSPYYHYYLRVFNFFIDYFTLEELAKKEIEEGIQKIRKQNQE